MKKITLKTSMFMATLLAAIGTINPSSYAADKNTSNKIAKVAETANERKITVYKSPTCGCCTKWEEHLKEHGFKVQSNKVSNMNSIKSTKGIPRGLQSCHTAEINGYLIEGHVPAKAILSMLEKKPKIKGLAVPGMPIGSPGMEMGDQKDPYNVISFDAKGNRKIYLKQ